MKTRHETRFSFSWLSRYTKAILLLATVFILEGCKIFDKAPEAKSPLQINTNPNDPLLARIQTDNNKLTELYGIKDANGVPQRIDRIVMLDDRQKTEANYLNFDEQSRLKSLIGSDGSKYLFSWQSDSKAILTYVSADGSKQINTEIDLDEPDGALRPANMNITSPESDAGQSPRRGQPIKIEQILGKKELTTQAYARAGTKLHELKVFVTQCDGLPVDAEEVSVIMYKNPDKLYLERIGEYSAYKITRGMYSAILPSDQATKIDVTKVQICNALKQVASQVACSNVSKVLRKLVKTGSLVSVPTIIATEIADRMVEQVCNIMAGQAGKNVCEQNFDDTPINLYTGDVGFIAAVVPTNGGEVKYSSKVVIDGGTIAYPDLKVELGGESKVNKLTLSPDRPLARQSYVADASVACLPYDTSVTISVVGTDGYENSRTLTVQNLDENGNFSIRMTVPGALQGVKDDIFINAITPAGKQITQKATLVFQ